MNPPQKRFYASYTFRSGEVCQKVSYYPILSRFCAFQFDSTGHRSRPKILLLTSELKYDILLSLPGGSHSIAILRKEEVMSMDSSTKLCAVASLLD